MAQQLSPEQERRLEMLAKAQQRDPVSMLDDLLSAAEEAERGWVDYARTKWAEGIAASERGQHVK